MGRGNSGLFSGTKGARNVATSRTEKAVVETRKEANNPLIDEALIRELEAKQTKFTREDMVFITKDKTGQIVWLEKGNSGVGLQHILERHSSQFSDVNVPQLQLSTFLHGVISNGSIIFDSVEKKNGIDTITRIYDYDGNYYILSGIGANGFMVTAHPIKKERK